MVATTTGEGQPIELWLVTDCLEHVAVGYRYRWRIELLVRWFKRILGCRHLISTKEIGATMPLYAALIASLLIVLWTRLKANVGNASIILHGWATEAELERHILRQKERQSRVATTKH